jgi:hypothetical protein
VNRLQFDPESGRWAIGRRELHCGDCFNLHPDTKGLPPIPVRIEMSSEGWYLITPYGLTKLSSRNASFFNETPKT